MNIVQIDGRNRQILAEAVGIAQGAEECGRTLIEQSGHSGEFAPRTREFKIARVC